MGTFIRIILTSTPTFLPMSQGLQHTWFRAVCFLLNFDNVDINKAVREHFCIIQASQLLAMQCHAVSLQTRIKMHYEMFATTTVQIGGTIGILDNYQFMKIYIEIFYKRFFLSF